jgi:hypothetical protein
MRWALYQASLIASYRNKYFVEYYTKILSGREREHGIKTKLNSYLLFCSVRRPRLWALKTFTDLVGDNKWGSH